MFSKQYAFDSYDDACLYLDKELYNLNSGSLIEKEQEHLNSYRPPFELGEITTANVNKYGCIRVDNNNYSVPNYLMSQNVVVKKTIDTIKIYSNSEFACEHKKWMEVVNIK